jgi:hypothetical protein
LRPLSWIKESNAQISATIFLDLPEMGAQGLAKVLNIEPCPPIKKGRGNVITGTFHHEAANTIDLYVEGLPKPIGCTDNHPFWSVTRNEFIEAGKLQQGEALQLHNGQTAKVIQILPRPGPERVHNLEVMNEHVYRVSDQGILVHNTYGTNGRLSSDLFNTRTRIDGSYEMRGTTLKVDVDMFDAISLTLAETPRTVVSKEISKVFTGILSIGNENNAKKIEVNAVFGGVPNIETYFRSLADRGKATITQNGERYTITIPLE